MKRWILTAAIAFWGIGAWAHSSIECRTKAVIEEIRPGGILASGVMRCDSRGRDKHIPVYVLIKEIRGRMSPHLVGEKVYIRTEVARRGGEEGEIEVDEDYVDLTGARVGLFLAGDGGRRPTRWQPIYSGSITEDGDIVSVRTTQGR